MPDPLSAGLITMCGFSLSCFMAVLCLLGRLLVAFCVKFALRASSRSDLKAVMFLSGGGDQSDGGQNIGLGA